MNVGCRLWAFEVFPFGSSPCSFFLFFLSSPRPPVPPSILILSIICPFQLRVRFVNFHMFAKTWLAHSSYLAAFKWAASHRSKQTGSTSLLSAALTPTWLLQRGREGNCTVTHLTRMARPLCRNATQQGTNEYTAVFN